MHRRTILAALLLTNAACATSFTGNAHVKGGRDQCVAQCKSVELELGGMVFLGEYSSGCVCVVPNQTPAQKQATIGGAQAAATGAVGVVMQMRAAEQQRGVVH
jgi:hypothetical protein